VLSPRAKNSDLFDSSGLFTHVSVESAGAAPAIPAFCFPVSHWNFMNIVIVESPAKA
jgi:DNA topoisomerase-1